MSEDPASSPVAVLKAIMELHGISRPEMEVARALCRIGGDDPDATVSIDGSPFQRAWRFRAGEARALLEQA